ncbi:MAG: c-type cytochrome [Anaerolineales bacterium]|nr:c-type cytochrome [Anaerolineales bacterium]
MNQNHSHRIEILLGLLGTVIIVVALSIYIFSEPERIVASQGEILHAQLDDAMSLYAENCAVCHGLNGEGLGATPPLNAPGLQSMPYDELYKVIARGRFETAMPAWSKEDGGPLSDYQIGELVALIESGDWNETGDRVVNLGLAPLIPFTTDPDPALLEVVGSLPDGLTLQTAITIYASQCVACHGADGLGTGIAPALNDPAVREKTVEELERTVTFGNAGTLMAGWSNVLTPEEISAMLTLIQRWDEVPTGAIPAPDTPIPTTEESIALGAELYSTNCSRCHGPEGQGKPIAPSLNVKSFLAETTDQAIQQIVTLGVPGTAMPAWGDRMTEAEIQAIVGFLRQWEATAPEVAQPMGPRSGVGGPPWLRNQNTTTTNPVQPAATPGIVPTQIPDAGGMDPIAQATAIAGHQAAGASGQAGSQMSEQDMATHMAQEAANGGGGGGGQGQGGPPWRQEQTQASEPEALDWRVLALIAGGLSIAFTLIAIGFSSLKRTRKNPPST